MKTLRGGLVVLVSAAATCLIALGATRASGAGANNIPVSGNVALVPSYPGIPIQPLATSDLPKVNGAFAVSPAAALSAAEAFDGFTRSGRSDHRDRAGHRQWRENADSPKQEGVDGDRRYR